MDEAELLPGADCAFGELHGIAVGVAAAPDLEAQAAVDADELDARAFARRDGQRDPLGARGFLALTACE